MHFEHDLPVDEGLKTGGTMGRTSAVAVVGDPKAGQRKVIQMAKTYAVVHLSELTSEQSM
jgi:hypothetical protein